VIVGKTASGNDPLLDATKYPGNTCEICLTRVYVKVMNSTLPKVVDHLLNAIGVPQLRAKEMQTLNVVADGTAVTLTRGTDFEFSIKE